MRTITTLVIAFFLIFLSACRKDFDTIESKGNLEFSKDTVLLNRVFDNISSSTQSFKVYNRSDDDITIPRISLGKGESSFYRLNVDGVPGKSFENIDILAKDSIYVFVEATIDFDEVTDTDFFYRDEVIFYAADTEQEVKLEALVLDVHLIRPDREEQPDGSFLYEGIVLGVDEEGEPFGMKGTYLDQHAIFTSEKPYLIYGYIGVPEGGTLTIDPGATLYFHNASGIIVEKDASLIANGTLENRVLFEDDRLEPDFEDTPGQWGTIWLRSGSKNNSIDYALIKNSSIGIIVDSIGSGSNPTLTVKNTQIYNTSNFGILGRETNILGQNLVIGNNGMSSLACTMGGSYQFDHCTFANFWNSSFRQFPAVLINNFFAYVEEDGTEVIELHDLNRADFSNCILEGNQNIEFVLDSAEGAAFSYNFKNCLLQFETTSTEILNSPLYDFENEGSYQNIILNGTPHFQDATLNEYRIGQDSDAINQGDITTALQVPFDILGVDRTATPDAGAYQHIIFEEEE